ncbi:MFS general substrate transporter [Glarea lozoyensis ATCC 20868]|uniref:MFS general substrate transporter n=1 Tax=Glarea lozoyensis (strain ATCC 20868 / MF5171) TaxID=1116229 RepID=S3DCI8_GLAL2|nr:MFS general substrate transporter [Glarea lozoyensis ATCC 20868]EPE34774.1 MFS general substrate transporter [Glarea lozoyensis ATCC 20868]
MPSLKGRALFAAVTSLTCLGFLLVGYDNGLMGGLVEASTFKKTFDNPSPTITGLMVAIYEVGCFIGSVVTSIFGERLGRKKCIGTGAVIMVLGAILQATAYSRAQMIVARVVSGIGMGGINSTVPVFQAEFSPKATRGLYVCMQLSTLNLGIFLAYWVDYGFVQSYPDSSVSFRLPCILQCIFLLPMLILLCLVPESPRWLASHSDGSRSLKVLQDMHTYHMSEEKIFALNASIVQAASYEASLGAGKWSALNPFRIPNRTNKSFLCHDDRISSRRRFFLACALQSMQQLGGINALIYYSTTLFRTSLDFTPHLASLMSGFLQTFFFLASFIPWALIDRIGRRPLLLSCVAIMSLVMATESGLIYKVQSDKDISKSYGIGAAAMLFLFEGAFTAGFQATIWVLPSELLPLRLRAQGSAVSTACNWIINYMIVQVTPIALDRIGWRTYIIFAVLNISFVPVIWAFIPETAGLELEEVDQLFINMRQQGFYPDDEADIHDHSPPVE